MGRKAAKKVTKKKAAKKKKVVAKKATKKKKVSKKKPAARKATAKKKVTKQRATKKATKKKVTKKVAKKKTKSKKSAGAKKTASMKSSSTGNWEFEVVSAYDRRELEQKINDLVTEGILVDFIGSIGFSADGDASSSFGGTLPEHQKARYFQGIKRVPRI